MHDLGTMTAHVLQMGLILHLGTPEALLMSLDTLTKLPCLEILSRGPRPRTITRGIRPAEPDDG
eukprot:3692990-Alexandrium_andersonii.AAC.1